MKQIIHYNCIIGVLGDCVRVYHMCCVANERKKEEIINFIFCYFLIFHMHVNIILNMWNVKQLTHIQIFAP